jgi:hypothetical protein
MTLQGKVGLFASVGILLVVAWLWRRPTTPGARGRASAEDEAPSGPLEPEAVHARAEVSSDPSEKASGARPSAPVLDRAKRDEVRRLIWSALGQPAPDASAPVKGTTYVFPERPPWNLPQEDASPRAGATPGIEPKYIQERVRDDFFPLAKKCYEDGLTVNPRLEGRVVFAFNIVGDAKIGGIVEAVDVLNESTLRDPEVIDCMRQSFLSVTFPPPPAGGTVTVVYPIVFSSGDGG